MKSGRVHIAVAQLAPLSVHPVVLRVVAAHRLWMLLMSLRRLTERHGQDQRQQSQIQRSHMSLVIHSRIKDVEIEVPNVRGTAR